MKRYAIWDKVSPVFTPNGKMFTAGQWMERYPIASLENVTVVCAAGEMNGGFFGTLNQLVGMYESEGCDFSGCITDEEKLAVIEAFMDMQDIAAKEAASMPTTDERIAAALEYQVMASLPDEEEEVIEEETTTEEV